MGNRIKVHLHQDFDKDLVPVSAIRHREWWEDNRATKDHARHCLPLSMANSLGFYILSPGTFKVQWDGDQNRRVEIKHIEKSSHYEVDAHAAFGSFTVQAKFIPVTDDPGDFVYIKGIPNTRGLPYSCMEAIIEAWWSVGNFGLVYMLNQPGEFTVQMGQPIAHMFLYHGIAGSAVGEIYDGYPEGYLHWNQRRTRKEYVKDLDYMTGKNSAGEKIHSHITNWKDATKFNGNNR
tara:strand:- start:525 stop:1226 length:702 start_codon:yes stop_codon:yes gene_type:complete